MKAPFPILALFAFLLLLVVAAVESFDVSFVPHVSVGVMLLLYIFGGVIGTLLADYMPHYSARGRAQRHGVSALRNWFSHR